MRFRNFRFKKNLKKVKKIVESIYQKAQEIFFRRLPSSVGTSLAIILAIAPVFLAGYMYYLGKKSHPSSYTVMVTNIEGTTGGSGVVIRNNASESIILTNRHVCEGALKKGGKVRLVNGDQHMVTGFVTDVEHDLCLLTVAADLENSITLAGKAPKIYSEATVTGHPALMPNIITKGHFGGRQIISVIVGFRKCKDSDLKNPDNLFFCAFFGVIPIIRTYESQVVSATIMGGSSGSAVLNEDGELSGIVFAGNARGLSYAYIVPFEAIKNFTEKTLKKGIAEDKNRPWLGKGSENSEDVEETNSKSAKSFFLEKCSKKPTDDVRIVEFCRTVAESIEQYALDQIPVHK